MLNIRDRVCGVKLHSLCMIIGYMHLASSIADVAYHLLTVAIVTNGFQCDVNFDTLRTITTLPWQEPLLTILNIGTHGFYPFPRVFENQYNMYVEYMAVPTVPRCYPGMLHLYLVDVLNFFINIIWLRIVISYVAALHNRDPEPMRMFFSLSIVKLVMQIMYLGYQPVAINVEAYWLLKLLDISITVFFLVIVRKYTNFLKAEIASQKVDKPPPYIECLISTLDPIQRPETCKKEAVINVEEHKTADTEKPNLDTPQ